MEGRKADREEEYIKFKKDTFEKIFSNKISTINALLATIS